MNTSKEYYTYFTKDQISVCKTLSDYCLCYAYQPLHSKSFSELCEASLFFNPTETPINSVYNFFNLTASLFHKLQFSKTWIYSVLNIKVVVMCKEDEESTVTIFKETRLLTIDDSY